MSANQQASVWSSVAYSAPTHHPVYGVSGQGTTMLPQPSQGELYCNQYQTQIPVTPSQGFAVTQTGSSIPYTTVQGNQPSCTPQSTQPGYQRMYHLAAQTGNAQSLQQNVFGYGVHTQATQEVPYNGNQAFAQSFGQFNELGDLSQQNNRQIYHKSQIQHEPCMHTLSKLETDMGVLKEQSAHQQREIKRLENSCKRKDTTISILKQQMSWKECKMKKLIEDCEKKDILIESLEPVKVEASDVTETPIHNSQETEGKQSNNKYLTEKANEAMMKEIDRLRIENKDVNRLQGKLSKLVLDPEEVKRAKQENLSQRLLISSLKQKLQAYDERSGMYSVSSSRDLTSCVESSSG